MRNKDNQKIDIGMSPSPNFPSPGGRGLRGGGCPLGGDSPPPQPSPVEGEGEVKIHFGNREIVQKLLSAIKRESKKPLRLMEVCGTHTVAIFRHGLRQLLPANIELISGPGCPVCVTPQNDIDLILDLAWQPDAIIATFGDLLNVPGLDGRSLKAARAELANVQIVYSPMDALELAQKRPDKKIIFPAIGFETTAPNIACTLMEARRLNIKNFFIIPLHKLIPPAMRALLSDKQSQIDGFICPGHVSVIIGWQAYNFISEEYGIPAAIAGFEPADILSAILALIRQHENENKYNVGAGAPRPKVENCYSRAVTAAGNIKAQNILAEIFEPSDSQWRGLGIIEGSGLKLREVWREYDAGIHFGISSKNYEIKANPCACGQILKGILKPPQCPLFKKVCTPSNPIGPCMVSSEGSCAAYFKYQ